jgi:hypothetical protein
MNQTTERGMTIRRITVADGRYMIFYEFSQGMLKPSAETRPGREKEALASRQPERGLRV